VPSSSESPFILGEVNILEIFVVVMGKSLEYALKVMPTKEAGRRNIIELGLGRACMVPMDGWEGCWSRKYSIYRVLVISWHGSKHMTLVIVLNG
jgi:hypothetical protein